MDKSQIDTIIKEYKSKGVDYVKLALISKALHKDELTKEQADVFVTPDVSLDRIVLISTNINDTLTPSVLEKCMTIEDTDRGNCVFEYLLKGVSKGYLTESQMDFIAQSIESENKLHLGFDGIIHNAIESLYYIEEGRNNNFNNSGWVKMPNDERLSYNNIESKIAPYEYEQIQIFKSNMKILVDSMPLEKKQFLTMVVDKLQDYINDKIDYVNELTKSDTMYKFNEVLSSKQMNEIRLGLKNHLVEEQLADIARDGSLTPNQMKNIRKGYECGLSKEDIDKWNVKDLSNDKIKFMISDMHNYKHLLTFELEKQLMSHLTDVVQNSNDISFVKRTLDGIHNVKLMTQNGEPEDRVIAFANGVKISEAELNISLEKMMSAMNTFYAEETFRQEHTTELTENEIKVCQKEIEISKDLDDMELDDEEYDVIDAWEDDILY